MCVSLSPIHILLTRLGAKDGTYVSDTATLAQIARYVMGLAHVPRMQRYPGSCSAPTLCAFLAAVFDNLDLIKRCNASADLDARREQTRAGARRRDHRYAHAGAGGWFSGWAARLINTPWSPPVRQNVVMVNLQALRAFIFPDRCLVLPPNGSDGILELVFNRLQTPFEVCWGVCGRDWRANFLLDAIYRGARLSSRRSTRCWTRWCRCCRAGPSRRKKRAPG